MGIFKKSEKDHQSEILQELRHAIDAAEMPSNARQLADKELETLPGINAEYSAVLNYIDCLLDLPWSSKTEDNLDILRVEEVLKERHYGLSNIKERIMEHLTLDILQSNRILIVDDEEIALINLEHILKKEGYSVTTANNGENALSKLDSTYFDVVMTDLKMEKIDGMEVLEKTKSKYPDAQVIIITGYPSTSIAVNAIKKGAFNYIEKPLRIDEVRSVIKQALEKKPATRPVTGSVLCFAGPPGTGKTSLGRAIADALGKKFATISLEGIKDGSEILGRRRTEADSMPGRIIEEVLRTGSSNPVLMLDKLDGIDQYFEGDIASVLLEALDPGQNHNFFDRYLNVSFDLSKVMFITTVNAVDNIPAPLKDRMEIIEFSDYTEDDKIKIALEYIVPGQIFAKGLSDYPPGFTSGALSRIIQGYTREAGVKDLERQIASVCRSIASEYVHNDEMHRSIQVGPELVEGYLGPAKY